MSGYDSATCYAGRNCPTGMLSCTVGQSPQDCAKYKPANAQNVVCCYNEGSRHPCQPEMFQQFFGQS